jgi:acetyl-CoA carboxylase alpha subunit
MANYLKAYLNRNLRELTRLPSEELLPRRYAKIRAMGLLG